MEPSSSESDSLRFFIGNLSEEIPEHMLREFCLGFGQLKECRVMKEDDTGRSRGFGFAEFTDIRTAERFARAFPHIIYDRHLNVKRCGGVRQPLLNSFGSKRVMVSHPLVGTHTYFLKHFSKFGPISKITYDYGPEIPLTGYTFIDFAHPDSANKCLINKRQQLDGAYVDIDVRKVLTKEQTLRILQKEREDTYVQAREQTGSHSTSIEITKIRTESILRNNRSLASTSSLLSSSQNHLGAQKRDHPDDSSNTASKIPRCI